VSQWPSDRQRAGAGRGADGAGAHARALRQADGPPGNAVVDVRLLGGAAVAPAAPATDAAGPHPPGPTGGPVVTGKVAVLLARLAAAGDGVWVGRDRLLADVWPTGSGDPGPLRVAVNRARATFGPEVIATSGSRYRIGPHTSDVGRFEQLVAAGRDVTRPLGERVAAFERGLAEWSGPVLEGVVAGMWARSERARLGELREVVVEEHLELVLAAGGHQRVLPELLAAAVAEPTREHRAWLAAVALYRCGRQAEALSMVAAWGRRLRDEFGLEPGPALRDLEQRILVHDPGLLLVSGAGPGPGPAPATAPLHDPQPAPVRGPVHVPPAVSGTGTRCVRHS
jgi:DNA-binding SARP family transcriptional activator